MLRIENFGPRTAFAWPLDSHDTGQHYRCKLYEFDCIINTFTENPFQLHWI